MRARKGRGARARAVARGHWSHDRRVPALEAVITRADQEFSDFETGGDMDQGRARPECK